MQKKHLSASLAAAALATAGVSGLSPAQAVSDNASEQGKVSSHTTTAQERQAAKDYWTADRMKSAQSADMLNQKAAGPLGAGVKSLAPAKGPDGPATRYQGKAADPTAQLKAKQQNKGKKGTAAAPAAASESPVKHIGKVFFTMGGKNYVCSANSVTSENGSTVTTAGHCLNEGPGGYATNFVFVPAYENGSAPYGKWAAESLTATDGWTQAGDMNEDTGFAVVEQLDGQKLGDVVGQSGVAFNEPRGGTFKSYGYPAAAPFDGETLKSCQGAAMDDPINSTHEAQGIPCDMTGGSSGGPWFLDGDVNGYQNSVNSYGYSGVEVMFGPYWNGTLEDLWNTAQTS